MLHNNVYRKYKCKQYEFETVWIKIKTKTEQIFSNYCLLRELTSFHLNDTKNKPAPKVGLKIVFKNRIYMGADVIGWGGANVAINTKGHWVINSNSLGRCVEFENISFDNFLLCALN